ncbi:MAG: trehalose-6-phosphate synthase [Nitriliruptorales bacterium]|nr:trehalose-6-phosphate synthase [Nitriliruptorales bacterium]
MTDALVVASNRGPVSWRRDHDGSLVARRGFGGLVTALGGALQREPGTWVSVALTGDDRQVAQQHVGTPFEVEAGEATYRLRLVDAGDRYDAYYNEVSNRLLWFSVHQLWGEPYAPSGIGWHDAWEDYRSVNAAVAEEAVAADAREVHLQDYHLTTCAPLVRREQPDAAILQYLHTPWCHPEYLRHLPDVVASDVMRGLLAADVVAFSSQAWCEAFRRCAARICDAAVDGEDVVYDGRRTRVTAFVLGVDGDDLAASAASDAVAKAGRDLDEERGDRALLLRVDRTDLSKNILRGLLAYELLLERHPQHRGRVWHYAHLNPSRQSVPEYREYLQRCRSAADRIRERFGGDCLTVFVGDDYPRAVAAQQRSDVLIANPVMDGTNLVAKEGPALNRVDGVLVLSPNAGAADVMGDGALMVNPYDVEEQAAALHRALTMDLAERSARAQKLRAAAGRGTPTEWFRAQRDVLRQVTAGRPSSASS